MSTSTPPEVKLEQQQQHDVANNNSDENKILPITTQEHQVGETEDGQPIMGRDRGEINFGIAAEANNKPEHEDEVEDDDTTLDQDVPLPPPTPRAGASSTTRHPVLEETDEAQQQQTQQKPKITVTNTASRRGSNAYGMHHQHHQHQDPQQQQQQQQQGTSGSRSSSLASDYVASPDVLAPSLVPTKIKNSFKMPTTSNEGLASSSAVGRSGAVSQQRSDSVSTDELMTQRRQQQQQQQEQQNNNNYNRRSYSKNHAEQDQQRRSDSPARSQTSSRLGDYRNNNNNNNNRNEVVDTPESEDLVLPGDTSNNNNNNNQQLVALSAEADDDERNLSSIPIPGTSQHHLYKFDEEYEDALKVYDSDVASSEAASRFAVGIHSTSASATRHFADLCALNVEETDRLAERRNKNAHSIRSWVGNELARYGIAGVAEELSQMTNVLVDDHRRRVELLEDRIRLQLKSTLSSILREQEHAGEALRAEFVKTASVEFAQDSLQKLIGGTSSSSSNNNDNNNNKSNNNNNNETAATTTASIMQSLRDEHELSKEEQAKQKGSKASQDAYTNELLQKLSKIYDRQIGFAVPKAQEVVSKARANFTRLAEKLSKIEDENVRRLAAQRDKAQKQISDLEALAANVAKTHKIKIVETEYAIEQCKKELERTKEDKKNMDREIWERQEEMRNRKKNSSGLSAGGLLFGLDYLNKPSVSSPYGSGGGGGANLNSSAYNNNDNDGNYFSKSKLDKDMDDKFKNATARSKALEERNAYRLQHHRDKNAEKNAQERAKNMSFAHINAQGKRTSAGFALGGGGGASSGKQQQQQQGKSGSNSPSLSRHNVANVESIPADEKTRRHLQDGNAVQTREIVPRDGVSVVTRNLNRRNSPKNNNNDNAGSPRSSFQQDPWVESDALRELVSRTAKHGLSFPDGSDPVIPTHKFLDDELAAIYELRHLRK